MHTLTGQNVPFGVIGCHQLHATNAETHVEVDGVRHSIWGHATRIVPITCPMVILLDPTCTPHEPKLDPEAPQKFQEAAERLIRQGVEFFTFLRPEWAVHAVRWTREFVS